MTRHLRGDKFVNRYRITGNLTTKSPLHIGSGTSMSEEADVEGETTQVTQIIRDHRGLPVIPGSALKGVMRHWLLQVLGGLDGNWAATHTYSNDDLDESMDIQTQQIDRVKNEFSLLELLFGTPWHAGKIDVWDCPCITTAIAGVADDDLTRWSSETLTYQETSVAIDPETGTAAEHLLYTAEVVPEGVQFQVNLCGQNLDDLEIGMLLLALQAFNSEIWPLTIGARSGRGYGRMTYQADAVYRLDASQVENWVQRTIECYGMPRSKQPDSGFYSLDCLSDEQADTLRKDALEAFKAEAGGQHV